MNNIIKLEETLRNKGCNIYTPSSDNNSEQCELSAYIENSEGEEEALFALRLIESKNYADIFKLWEKDTTAHNPSALTYYVGLSRVNRENGKYVWFAWDSKRKRMAVAKILKNDNEGATLRFKHELQLIKKFDVPLRTGSIELRDYDPNHRWYSMAFIRWGEFSAWVDAFENNAPLGTENERDINVVRDSLDYDTGLPSQFNPLDFSAEYILKYFASAARILSRMHDRNFYHLDLSPSNMLVMGRTKYADQNKPADIPSAILIDLERSVVRDDLLDVSIRSDPEKTPTTRTMPFPRSSEKKKTYNITVKDEALKDAWIRIFRRTQQRYTSPELCNKENTPWEKLTTNKNEIFDALSPAADVYSMGCIMLDYFYQDDQFSTAELYKKAEIQNNDDTNSLHIARQKFANSDRLKNLIGSKCAAKLATAISMEPKRRCSARELANAMEDAYVYISPKLYLQRIGIALDRVLRILSFLMIVVLLLQLLQLSRDEYTIYKASTTNTIVLNHGDILNSSIPCSEVDPNDNLLTQCLHTRPKRYVLLEDSIYYLNRILVLRNSVLVIQPGVKIIAKNPQDRDFSSAIIITQSARIEASGTNLQPIVMTSQKNNLVLGEAS